MKTTKDDWVAAGCCVVIVLAVWYAMIVIAAHMIVSL